MLSLLQEVAQVEDAKIDWNALVKRTATGITNPREYQMLWRHLAYRDPLLENLEDEAKPLVSLFYVYLFLNKCFDDLISLYMSTS